MKILPRIVRLQTSSNRSHPIKCALLILAISTFSTHSAYACQKNRWDHSTWVKNSTQAYEGVLVGKSLPEIEQQVTMNPSAPLHYNGDAKSVRVVIQKSLKGDKKAVVEAVLHWCKGGDAQLGEPVLIVQYGEDWHIESLSNLKRMSQTME